MNSTSKLRNANWTELTLELVVVVVGILLALGIDSWRAERQERALEVSILTQLETDLVRADEQLSGEIAKTEAAAQSALDLLAAARGGREVPDDSIVAWITGVSWWSDPFPATASAQALVSSNSLHVIQSDALRSSVVTFLDQVRQLESRIPRHELEITEWMNRVADLSDPLSRGPMPYVGVLNAGVEAYVDDAIGGPVTADLQPLLKDPLFHRVALDLFWTHENLRWLQQMIVEATRSLAAEVRLALEAGHT